MCYNLLAKYLFCTIVSVKWFFFLDCTLNIGNIAGWDVSKYVYMRSTDWKWLPLGIPLQHLGVKLWLNCFLFEHVNVRTIVVDINKKNSSLPWITHTLKCGLVSLIVTILSWLNIRSLNQYSPPISTRRFPVLNVTCQMYLFHEILAKIIFDRLINCNFWPICSDDTIDSLI